jgi:hypothetical protein
MQATLTQAREGGHGVALWALAGFVLYVLGGMAMLFVSLWIAEAILASQGIDSSAGTLGLSIRNAAHPIGWGLFVAAASIPIGSRLVPGLRFGAASWVMLAVGLTLASITTFLDIEFIRASHGYYDFEYGGLTGFAGPALVAIALAAWASLGVPASNSGILAVLTLTAVAGLAVLLLPSVGGAADGIDAENIPIAAALVADVSYGAVVALVVLGVRLGRA